MNKIEIEIPVGKEVDWEASAKQKQIVLKDKQLTYEDVCKKLFKNGYCYISTYGDIRADGHNENFINESTNASTRHQLECILAKNKLANVAVYLNNGWKPNLEADCGSCIVLDCYGDLIFDSCAVQCAHSSGKVMFKSRELAKQAIKILGEDVIRLALEPLY